MGELFAPKPKTTPPPRMPDPQDPRVLEAERRKRMQNSGQSGRASTILSQGGNVAPSMSYTNSLLGQ